MAAPTDFAANKALVIQRHRHLKWPWLDPLESLLMVLCGICISGFTLCVLCDVITRSIGHPWLWLQQATTAFFAWGVFIGMAVAVRRHEHIYLAEITKKMTGASRRNIETFNRVVVMLVAAFMLWFGFKNAILDLGSYRMPWLIPLTVYTGIVPISGALIILFCIEQIANGWKNGYEGPEDTELLMEPTE